VPVQLPGVRDLWHVRTLHVREPGELGSGWQRESRCQLGWGRPGAVIPAWSLPSSRTGQ